MFEVGDALRIASGQAFRFEFEDALCVGCQFLFTTFALITVFFSTLSAIMRQPVAIHTAHFRFSPCVAIEDCCLPGCAGERVELAVFRAADVSFFGSGFHNECINE